MSLPTPVRCSFEIAATDYNNNIAVALEYLSLRSEAETLRRDFSRGVTYERRVELMRQALLKKFWRFVGGA